MSVTKKEIFRELFAITAEHYRKGAPLIYWLVLFEVVTPFIKRVITIVVLIGAFRAFANVLNGSPDQIGHFIDVGQPVFLAAMIFLILVPLCDFILYYLRRKSGYVKRNVVKNKEGIYVLIPKQLMDWHLKQHTSLVVYILSMPITYGLLALGHLPAMFTFIASEVIFWLVVLGLKKYPPTARFGHNQLQVGTLLHVTFIIYLISTAYLTYLLGSGIDVTHIFLFIMLPRVQLENLGKAAKYLTELADRIRPLRTSKRQAAGKGPKAVPSA